MKKSTDYVFLAYFIALLLFGLLMLSSAGVAVGLERFGDPYFFVKRQLLFGVLPGTILFLIIAKIDYHVWKKIALPVFLMSIVGLFLVFIPGIGTTHNTNAHSWISFFGYSFQPAESAKLALVIYMAGILSTMGNKIKDLKEGFLLALGVGIVPVFLIALQPDIGTTAILFAILMLILFFAHADLKHLSILILLAIIGFGTMIVVAPYRAERFMTFLHPELDPQGQGYQINQAFLAIGSGGWLGLGLGHSRQKFQYLPEVHADSIFAIIAEEMGFIVMTGVLFLFILITLRGLNIAKHAPDEFGKLLAVGILSWFMIQTLLNIGAIVGLLPLTGVPLPFVSHGGSALIIAMAGLGMIINVSKKC